MDEFKAQVTRQIGRLRCEPLNQIEAQVAQKRSAWFQKTFPHGFGQPATPRRAYETLFGDYMGLNLDEVPLVQETEDEVVWLSRNACPTLEACQTLGLDTRCVCRAAYEKSTQAFVSQIDPRLRFLRSYTEIRPHHAHCREMILRLDFEAHMRLAIQQAHLSRRQGNKGYGAVVVLGRRILAQAYDTAVSERDPSLHAEVNAIRQAVQSLGDSNLCGAILFSTCEPCPMCSSLAVWANLTSIVFGVSIAETAHMGKARIRVSAQEIVAQSPALVEVIGGVLQDECAALYA